MGDAGRAQGQVRRRLRTLHASFLRAIPQGIMGGHVASRVLIERCGSPHVTSGADLFCFYRYRMHEIIISQRHWPGLGVEAVEQLLVWSEGASRHPLDVARVGAVLDEVLKTTCACGTAAGAAAGYAASEPQAARRGERRRGAAAASLTTSRPDWADSSMSI